MTEPLLRTIPVDQLPKERRRPLDRPTLAAAAAILSDIETRGEQAVLDHAMRLGDLRPGDLHLHDQASLHAALDRFPVSQRLVLERTAARIKAFAQAQRACLTDLDVGIEGGRAGHTCLPVRTAGCYAPGGRVPLPSSVLMTVITARTAGVCAVWAASPKPTDATLAAAAIAGADGLLAIGGVQAIGALAHGLCGVPECDMIVGPGNRWVTAAKFLVSDRVGIDMLAGPSELVVLADDSADPVMVAADLLAQAEHDEDAVPILVSTSPALPARVEDHLRAMLESLPTRATAIAALHNGFAVVVQDLGSAVSVCDALAPEHLEIMTRNASRVAAAVRNTGAVFIGAASAEVFGDYGAGPNHVLPTGGTARFKSGLSAFTFLRSRTWLQIDGLEASRMLREDAAVLARIESLEAHARATELRS
jgi:phosphoribosyl-ATP pyrophosphohydrolase/phosphoribosyl-AMP cyclohydrolase/histidinol dehydrogenase